MVVIEKHIFIFKNFKSFRKISRNGCKVKRFERRKLLFKSLLKSKITSPSNIKKPTFVCVIWY